MIVSDEGCSSAEPRMSGSGVKDCAGLCARRLERRSLRQTRDRPELGHAEARRHRNQQSSASFRCRDDRTGTCRADKGKRAGLLLRVPEIRGCWRAIGSTDEMIATMCGGCPAPRAQHAEAEKKPEDYGDHNSHHPYSMDLSGSPALTWLK